MNENEINDRLKNEKNYLGSFAIDEQKDIKVTFFPSFCVLNLDVRSSVGSHWIALAIYPSQVFICDSLGGLLPSSKTSKNIANFLSPILKNRKVIMTRQLQQSYSDTCGLYCVTFIQQLSKHNCFCEFLRLFTNENAQNDTIIKFLNKKV